MFPRRAHQFADTGAYITIVQQNVILVHFSRVQEARYYSIGLVCASREHSETRGSITQISFQFERRRTILCKKTLQVLTAGSVLIWCGLNWANEIDPSLVGLWEFEDGAATGVNAASVTTLSIGMEGGQTGVLYVDDIMLTKP